MLFRHLAINKINIHQPSWWFFFFGQLALNYSGLRTSAYLSDLPVLHLLLATRKRVFWIKYA